MPDEKVKKDEPLVAPPEEVPLWKGSLSATEEIIAPDGHVVLSKEDADRVKKGN